MVVWRYALLPLVCLLLALTHSLVGLANLVLVVRRAGDGLTVHDFNVGAWRNRIHGGRLQMLHGVDY